jgi:hypothetical protein
MNPTKWTSSTDAGYHRWTGDQPIQKPSDLGPFLRFMSDLKILLSALRDNTSEALGEENI